MMNVLLKVSGFLMFAFGSYAGAITSEIKEFRYSRCEAEVCIVVQAPKGSLSSVSEDFAASGDDAHAAIFRLLRGGKSIRDFKGFDIVSRLVAGMVTVESKTEVAIINIKSGTYLVFKKGDLR